MSEKACFITSHEILKSKCVACHLRTCVHYLVNTADKSELCISTSEGRIIEGTVQISISDGKLSHWVKYKKVIINETCFKGPPRNCLEGVQGSTKHSCHNAFSLA